MKQVFLHGPLDRMKKNVLPDYPTDDVPIGFYFHMKNTLNHRGDRIPSGLSVISRAKMEACVSFLDSGKNLTRLHEAITTGVRRPHLLLLQTAHILMGWKMTFGVGLGKSKQMLWRGMVRGHQHLRRGFRVPFREQPRSVLSWGNFTPKDPLVHCLWL